MRRKNQDGSAGGRSGWRGTLGIDLRRDDTIGAGHAMRLFVTGPDAADSFAHNVAHTLREMGHDVRTDPRVGFDMRQSRVRVALDELLSRASRGFRLRRESRAIRIASEFRPDVTLMCTMTFEPETVARIRRASGGRVVCWYGDTPANLRRDHLLAGEYDAVFAKDPDFVALLRSMLGLEAHHLPEACNPAWHRPVARRAGNAVVVAGSCYAYRVALAGRLLEAGQDVRLYGPAPPPWTSEAVRRAHTGIFLDHRSKALVFGEALACLGGFAVSEGRNSVNCRVFESCGCGALLVCEARPALAAFFEPGKEFLPFASHDECLDHLRRVRRDYSEAERIRERAVRRAHAEHTYRHRLERLFATLGGV